eukprot:NODE_684_length_1951_cov_34.514254_g635_i0.p1 GENE.NODE_684_length_1951_cov_34.514254_g635_i0~~NODE_684_length_1951_cov_34.514254_g635_i0.p1  ORF type:complete len:607 (+),score=151.82 NODE_684_length_1951_cov_34.514254_g635_i0:54-1823(+)
MYRNLSRLRVSPALHAGKRFKTEHTKTSFFDRVLGPNTVEASPSFTNRWLMVLPAFGTHMCIGSPWAWSAVSGSLTKEFGFVVPAAADWSLSQCTIPLSIVFALQGISAALAGKWQMRVGPRCAMVVAGLCFGGGLMVGSLGIALHSLPLLYFGYGFLAGCGVGIAYTPPLQCLIQWFPDRKGLASGLTIAGFGSGGMFFAPTMSYLMKRFAVMPEHLGTADQVTTVVQDGRLFADVGGALKEVVIANGHDLAALPYTLPEGVYVVGSGSTGSVAALGVCGFGYFVIMMASAFAIRRPSPSYLPQGYTSPAGSDGLPQRNVTVDAVMKTPQFYLLASTFFCVATGGMGLFSVAKPMMSEVFSGSLPTLVTASFGTGYLLMLTGANLSGRLGWAAFSDRFGRRTSFQIFTLGSIPLYLLVPYCVSSVVSNPSAVPLSIFMVSTVTAITCMGGTYAILPAYESDLFGAKYVGAIHGRMLLASTAAALVGPNILLALRNASERTAINELLTQVDPERFQATFNAPISTSQALIETKTLSISKLMEIAPPGVVDPTPFLYNTTMYTMAGFMAIACLSHHLVKPVDPKHFEKEA